MWFSLLWQETVLVFQSQVHALPTLDMTCGKKDGEQSAVRIKLLRLQGLCGFIRHVPSTPHSRHYLSGEYILSIGHCRAALQKYALRIMTVSLRNSNWHVRTTRIF